MLAPPTPDPDETSQSERSAERGQGHGLTTGSEQEDGSSAFFFDLKQTKASVSCSVLLMETTRLLLHGIIMGCLMRY